MGEDATGHWRTDDEGSTENGWTLDRVKGSAHIMVRGNKTVSVHVHAHQVLKPGTLAGILRDADLSNDDLRKLL